jgi:IS5 family transposase
MVLLSDIFHRQILKHAAILCPETRNNRPRTLGDNEVSRVIFKVARTGMQWREIRASVSYATVFRRAQTWAKLGVVDAAYQATLRTYKRLFPTTHYCIDSTYVKNAFGRECVGRNHTDRGRKALKLSVLTDQLGTVHGLSMDPGNRNDVILLQKTLSGMLTQLESVPLYADRGYDSKTNRQICANAGLRDRIFRRRTKTTRKENAKRVVVEHTFAWLDRYRRLLFFYEQSSLMFQLFTLFALGNLLTSRYLEGKHKKNQNNFFPAVKSKKIKLIFKS